FWERVWASAGIERDAAFDDLVAALGQARAESVEAELVPVNLRDPDVKPDGSLAPHVAFLDLPDPPALPVSREDWTRGARTWLLPERLVLLGYQAGKEVLHRTGEPIPAELQVGPDPSAPEDEQLKADGADLDIPEAMRWTVDFDEAVAKGMGFLVDLTESGLDPGFDRLFVLGVRVGSDAEESAAECEELIRHHQASRKGFSLLPQGRATNNTDQASAGYSWWESHEEAFAHFHPAAPHADPPAWDQRRDGAWLAGLLGLDPKVLQNSPFYYGTDQAEARAVNVALWPATLGYYMEQMLEPVFSEEEVRATRDFFGRFVLGRGTVPLVRIGRQPYGVLPATAWSKAAWWQDSGYARAARVQGLPDPSYLGGLHALSERAADLWRGMAAGVSNVGNPGPDPQQTLLRIIGLHPTSADFYQRYAQSFTQYYNLLSFEPFLLFDPVIDAARRYVEAGLRALADLGWPIPPGAELPELLEKIFLKKANPLNGDLVAAALSETEPLPASRADGRNYIAWLRDAARSSHDTLRRQEGFTDGPPTALLYLMLRHALDLGFVEGGLELTRKALSLSDAAFRAQRKEPKMMSVVSLAASDSRWDALYRPEPAVTGSAELKLGDFLPGVLAARNLYLDRQLKALDLLEQAPTARLERAFVEHLDCLSYRFDAWRLGLQAVQLSFLRGETDAGFART
ncbi:MAG TPA: hypothetical protein VEA60_02700, partial [Allosphingosinicella sp.]|nr:hypothetical protein [Allosphingosinicella sp.]